MNFQLPVVSTKERRRERLLEKGYPQNAVALELRSKALRARGDRIQDTDKTALIRIVDEESWRFVGDRMVNGEDLPRWELEAITEALLAESVRLRAPLEGLNKVRTSNMEERRREVEALYRRGLPQKAIAMELSVDESTISKDIKALGLKS